MSRQAKDDLPALSRTLRFGIKLLFALTLPLAVAFTVLAEPLTLILGGERYLPDGAIALQLMIWSIPIGWMNSLMQYALVSLGLQRMITRAFVIAVLFNVVANLIFIPEYGLRAAAIATIASEVVLFLPFVYLLWSKLHDVNIARLVWRPLIALAAMLPRSVYWDSRCSRSWRVAWSMCWYCCCCVRWMRANARPCAARCRSRRRVLKPCNGLPVTPKLACSQRCRFFTRYSAKLSSRGYDLPETTASHP